jgi:hypothetical protein
VVLISTAASKFSTGSEKEGRQMGTKLGNTEDKKGSRNYAIQKSDLEE